jgi:hypothetical protein
VRVLPMIRVLSVLLLAAAPAAGDGARPPAPDWQTDAACTWEWREGGGFGLWTERCALSTGLWEIVWDAAAGAFVQAVDGRPSGILVQPFAVADREALRHRLLEAGGLAPDAPCAFKAAALRPAPKTMAMYVLMPTMENAFAPTAEGDVPEPLCGPYGASTHGVRYLVEDLRWPGVAVFVEEGQERPMFDPMSLTRVTGG